MENNTYKYIKRNICDVLDDDLKIRENILIYFAEAFSLISGMATGSCMSFFYR